MRLNENTVRAGKALALVTTRIVLWDLVKEPLDQVVGDNGGMSEYKYKIVDTQFERERGQVSLTQIVHARIPRESGETRTIILTASVTRRRSEKWGSHATVSVLKDDGEIWGGIVSSSAEDIKRHVPSPKIASADHRAGLQAIAESLFQRAIRVLTID